ncbi:potassium transporter [Cynara cardunculus var. scolymus]|uniref:Potassium transporter n=1 Tax=Cynara cardunculus var. scolymus TaxID=59895 RepID=A0A103R0G3_CYNCS|nr:potassium transporter [Cynara cardunculus var. scolymus]
MEVDLSEEIEAKGGIWALEQKIDQPMDEEAGRLKNMYREKKFSVILLLRLAFQSLGVVYGDLGTSPLYVFYNTFPKGIDDAEDVIGALSLIIYSLTLVPLIKYVFIVCRANDNGQGGTFALYSLLCRHAKVNTIPNQHRTDEDLTTYSRSTIHKQSFAAKTKRWLEAHAFKKNALLLIVLVGTCMVIGDGILTPAISGSCLFSTSLYNVKCSIRENIHSGPIINYDILTKIFLSASGGIKIDHPRMSNDYSNFYLRFVADVVILVSVIILLGLFSLQHYGPDKVGWLFAPIELEFSTSANMIEGYCGLSRLFSDDLLKLAGTEALFADLAHFPVSAIQLAFTVIVFPCLLLAYCGQAAYLMKNKEHVYDAFYRSIPVVECTYFSAVLFKINQGGWVPLVIAGVFLLIMYIWHYGTVKRYEFEMHSKISMAWILGLGPSLGLVRVPGVGLVYTELASGVPHIFSHLITNLPAVHSVVVFVCVKYLPVYMVPEDERFLVKRIGPKNFHMFRIVARYGYKDLLKKDDEFEKKLFDNLFLFIRLESMMEGCSDSDEYSLYGSNQQTSRSMNDFRSLENDTFSSEIDLIVAENEGSGKGSGSTEVDEAEFLMSCRAAGVVHIMGNTVVTARRGSRFYKKISIDYIYAFMRKICREHSVIFNVPHETLLNVGQVFYV